MGLSISDYGADLVLGVLLNQDTMPATLYLALCGQQPDPSWSGTDLAIYEPSAIDSAYERLEVTLATDFVAPEDGVSTNTPVYTWDTPTVDWGDIAFFALCDADTDGEIVYIGSLVASFYVAANAIVRLDAGTINLAVSSLTDYGTDS